MSHILTQSPTPSAARVYVYRQGIEVKSRGLGRFPSSGGKRGAIYEFSKESRLRLMKHLARANRIPDWFVSLTYPREYPELSEAKEHARRFLYYVIRYHKRANARCYVVWRVEWQRRGAPHFHLLVWSDWKHPVSEARLIWNRAWADDIFRFYDSDDWEDVYRLATCTEWYSWLPFLSVLWWRITGRNGDDHLRRGVDLKAVGNERQAMAYCSKYCAKVGERQFDMETGEVLPLGRIWGAQGDKDFVGFDPIGKLDDVTIHELHTLEQHMLDIVPGDYLLHVLSEGHLSYWLFASEDVAGEFLERVHLVASKERA